MTDGIDIPYQHNIIKEIEISLGVNKVSKDRKERLKELLDKQKQKRIEEEGKREYEFLLEEVNELFPNHMDYKEAIVFFQLKKYVADYRYRHPKEPDVACIKQDTTTLDKVQTSNNNDNDVQTSKSCQPSLLYSEK